MKRPFSAIPVSFKTLATASLSGLFCTTKGLNIIPGLVTSSQLSNIQDVVKSKALQLTQLSTQVGHLSQSTHQVLQLSTGTAIFSGLGLVVSGIGFAVINNRLNLIDKKLKDIQKDVQAIQQFLGSTERAKLVAALEALLKLELTPVDHRPTILHNARNLCPKSTYDIAIFWQKPQQLKQQWRMKSTLL